MSLNEADKNHNDIIHDTDLPISDSINNYKMEQKIGEGRFSKVYQAIHKLTSEKVAIKIIFKNINTSHDLLKNVKSEIEILKRVKHNNICKLFSVIETDERIYIIQEYIEGNDLLFFIKQKEKLQNKLKIICNYFRQIISALYYLHNILGIAHRDLKPENILINEKNEIKLVDFGFGKIYKLNSNNIIKLTTQCGSPSYVSPEMLKGNKYNGNISDVWSIGVILYFMLFGELPFYDVDIGRLYNKIKEGKYYIPKDKANIVGKDAIDLIKKLLEKDPKKRIKINDIMEHIWFKKENDVLYKGININEIIIPIDEEIVEEMNNKYGYNKERIRISIWKNEYNNIRSIYLILLQKKIKSGKKSVADLKSDLYIDYINDENNKMIRYENNIENVIKQKLKIYIEDCSILNKQDEIDKNNNQIEKLSFSEPQIENIKDKTKVKFLLILKI